MALRQVVLPELTVDVFSNLNDNEVIGWLRQQHLLRLTPPNCPTCGVPMELKIDLATSDGLRWRHRSKVNPHDHRISIRDGSFFSGNNATGHRIQLRKMLNLLFLWSSKVSLINATSLLEVSKECVVDWFGYARDICSWKLLQFPLVFGGPGVVVEIDESLFFKRKNNVGHEVPQQWVFGIYQPDIKRGYLCLVDRRDAATLIPIIQQHVAPQSIIHSDMWAAYHNLVQLPQNYQHLTVNHQTNFVNPVNSATTNHVESYWRRAKQQLKSMYSIPRERLPMYLDEFLWRDSYSGNSCLETFNNLLDHITERYDLL